MAIKTLLTADDFGFSENINKAIIEAYLAKRISELSLMVDCFGSREAVELIKKHNIKNVGLHFSLVRISKNGKLLRGDDYDRMLRDWSSEEFATAFDEEIKMFTDLIGFVPSHIIGHKHISLHSKVVHHVAKYCVTNNCYARRGERLNTMSHFTLKANHVPEGLKIGRIADAILGFKYGTPEEMYHQYKEQIVMLKKTTPVKSIEIFFHPGYSGEFEKTHTSFIQERIDDINFLMSDWFTKLVDEERLSIVPSSEI